MSFISILAIALLCLLFRATRMTGVVGLCILSLIKPWLLLVLIVLSGLSLYFFKEKLI